MDASRKLASSILFRALVDAQKGSREALAWIQEGGPGFRFLVCRAYGLCPVWARKGLRTAIVAAPITRKRRRELVIQALRENPELSNRGIGRRLKVNYETVRKYRSQTDLF